MKSQEEDYIILLKYQYLGNKFSGITIQNQMYNIPSETI